MMQSDIFEEFKKDFSFSNELKDSIAILQGGKGFRAKLISLLGSIFKIENNNLNLLMDITESLHTATLVHDDVLDNASHRRGVVSFNHVIGNKKSILLGDYYLAKTIYNTSLLNDVELVKEVSKVLESLVQGEWLQASLNQTSWSKDTYFKVANFKTGSIFSWCILSVLIIKLNKKNLSHKNIDLINNIGSQIGLLFQIVDDYMDFNNDNKTVCADLKNGNINYFLLNIKDHVNIKAISIDELISLIHASINSVEDEVHGLSRSIKDNFNQLITQLNLDEMKGENITNANAKFSSFVDELKSRYKY